MEMADKLRQLGAGAAYEVAAPTTRGHPPTASEPGICRVAGRGGSALLRVLMTDACEHDCHFCPLRASAPRRRTAFAPTELARLFGQMHAAGKVDGLFLSSGIAGPPDATMEHMLAAVELIRRREGFDGYVHLKLLPGASDAAIEAAARLASRVSINVEVPNGAYLARLHTGKDMLRFVRPRYCLPLHGEYRMLIEFRTLAAEMGIPEDHVLMTDIGDVIEFRETGAKHVGTSAPRPAPRWRICPSPTTTVPHDSTRPTGSRASTR